MFRPVPHAARFRWIPYRPIAAVVLTLALVVAVVLLLSLEREKLLLRGLVADQTLQTEQLPSLWQSRRDLIVTTLLVFLISAIGIAAVITLLHHENTRRTLEEVKGLARNILQSIPTGILTLNGQGTITAVNPAAESVLKRPSAALLGQSYETVFAEGDTIRAVLRAALQDRRHITHNDVPYDTQDQTPHTIRVTTADLPGEEGQPRGVILQAQDVTEWLALEQRVRVADKLSALHTLSAGVAHELRNPLSAMDLNLHLLEEELRDRHLSGTQAAHYLMVLNAECRRLSAILDTFQKFAGPGSMGRHEIRVQDLIEHIASLMRIEADERGITIEQSVERDLPHVMGDETQISQVLVNVVVNAFHAMPHGGRCRISACERSREGGRSVEVTVQDTGVGIPQQDLQRVFEPFYTTKSGGTGLGLAIAYRIMQDHGGSIHLSSSPGSGTTMVLRFPVSARHPQPTEVG